MKINAVNNVNNNILISKKDEKRQDYFSNNLTNVPISYPQNYYVSFCAKKNTDAIYQEHKDTEMPSTVRDYYENQEYLLPEEQFEALKKMGIKAIQKAAFQSLEDCYSIQDIQRKFPNEVEFKNLKRIQEVHSDSKFFSTMQKLENKGVKTLTCKEDIATYCVKKIYLEGKTFKDTLEDLKTVISPEAEELKDILNSYTTPRAVFFSPLGFTPPNGQTYGRDLQFSDPEFVNNRREYFSTLTPEQVNERIKKLLESNEKAKISMMDAWNHCENVRNDLSKHLLERIGSLNGGSFDFYDPSFYSKMKLVMNQFWAKYPQHKKTLGNEIKVALEKYDKFKGGKPEDFEVYKTEIKKKSQEIRNRIRLQRQSENPELSVSEKMLQKIVQKANPMTLRTGSSNKDFYTLLINRISENELEILEGETNTREYQALFPDGIKEKMRRITRNSSYINLFNAQNIAILRELQVNGSLSDEEMTAMLFSKNLFGEKMKELVSSNENLSIDNVNLKYDRYKTPLTQEDKVKVKKALIERNPHFKNSDSTRLDSILKTQGQYAKFILNDGVISDVAEVFLWKEFDRLYGSDYAGDALRRINSDINISSAISIIDDIDFSNILN